MPKEIMRPDRLCSAAAVVRYSLSNDLVVAEACLPERLRFSQCPKNKDPIAQTFGDRGLHRVQAIYVIIEVDQQNHKALGVFSHAVDMNLGQTDGGPGSTLHFR